MTSIQHGLRWDSPHAPATFILQEISLLIKSVRGCVKLVINILRFITVGWNVITSRRMEVSINLTAEISCYQTTSGQTRTYAGSYNAGI
jgi:hypothetical protein